MYSPRNTRTLSICLLMVLSAVGPMAVPAGAEHDSDDWPWLSLDLFENGSWVNVDHEAGWDAPFSVMADEGDTLMHLSAHSLELNETYNMTWSVETFDVHSDDEGNGTSSVTHTREWFSYTNTSGESWNLTMGAMDCWALIDAQLEHIETDGSRHHVAGYTFVVWGPCGINGIVELSAEIGGTWVDLEPYSSDLLLTGGTYNLQFGFNNLSANSTYEFEYFFEGWQDYSEGDDFIEESITWMGTNTSSFDTWSIDVEPWYCEMVIDGWLWEITNNTSEELLGGFVTFPQGECEEPPQHIELWHDGTLYEPIVHVASFDECEEFSEDDGADHDYFECWQDDWDEDGDGEPNWTDHKHDCVLWGDDVSNETWWECEAWREDPYIEAGNHSMVLNITELNVDEEYFVSLKVNQHYNRMGDDWEYYEFTINTTGFTGEPIFEHIPFSVVTENWTCGLWIEVELLSVDNAWGDMHHIDQEWFNFGAPCEERVSPFTLTYDGVEWEEEWHYDVYDHCEASDEGDGEEWYCSQEEWDWDDDGVYDMWDHRNDCTLWGDDVSNETWWECRGWSEDPFIDPGNHSVTLLVEDLEPNTNYSLGIHLNVCQNMMGCDWESDDEYFNTGSETNYTTSGWFLTDEYTCYVNLHIQLDIEETDGSNDTSMHNEFWDDFQWRGPCEVPPSPFTVSTDGVDYEMTEHYSDYDDCEDLGDHYECSMDGWDEDGDGEPDWHDYQEDCHDDDADGIWTCVTWLEEPQLDPGNHSMVVTVDDLEAGSSYILTLETWGHSAGWGGDFNDLWWEVPINASSANESISFWMETNEQTCHVNMHLSLQEVTWTTDNSSGESWPEWVDDVFFDYFSWGGPCVMPPSPFTLYNDGVEWETIEHYDEYDNCEDISPAGSDKSEWRCWPDEWDADGNGEPESWDHRNDCNDDDGDGIWECASWREEPPISEGNHSMTLDIDVDSGQSYVLNLDVWVHEWDGSHSMQFEHLFNSSSDLETFAFSVVTDNSTCGVGINAHLDLVEWHDDGGWYGAEIRGWDNFHYNGPCEMPHYLDLWYENETGVNTEWETVPEFDSYDYCDPMGGDDYECWDEGDEYRDWARDCVQAVADPSGETWWDCIVGEESPYIEAGNYTMTWVLQDLEVGNSYDLFWTVHVESFGSYDAGDAQYFSVNASDADGDGEADEYQVTWNLTVSPEDCWIQINTEIHMLEDWDGDGLTDGSRTLHVPYFNFDGPCEINLPVDLALDHYDDGTGVWNNVTLVPNEWLFDEPDVEDCEYDEEDLCILIYGTGYDFEFAGDQLMRWSMDGLTVGEQYTVITVADSFEGEGPGNDWYWCADSGYDIPFEDVNDGDTDCDDGSDEPSYDSDGNEISWFSCASGEQIPLSNVNNGINDCADGSDEYEGPDNFTFNASAATELHEWDYHVSDDTCFDILYAQVFMGDDSDEYEGTLVGMGLAIIAGPASAQDDNGDGIPDCLGGPDGGPEPGEERWYWCADGSSDIPFQNVNDGNSDCPDGSDEPSYDSDGNEISWFSCSSGEQILLSKVNNGIFDCADGSDEYEPGSNEPMWGSENGNLGFLFTDGSGDPSAVESAWPYMKIDEGQYTVQFEAFMLDPGTNVTFEYEFDAQGHTIMEGEFTLIADSDGHAITDDYLLEIDTWDCFLFVGISLTHTDSGDWVDDYNMMLEGPCEGGTAEGLISVDVTDSTGASWPPPDEGGIFDECEDHQGYYECWQDDWDENGDGIPDWTVEVHGCDNWYDDVSGTDWWECPSFLDDGQYEFSFDVIGLDPGQEYEITGGAYNGIHGVHDAVMQLFVTEEPPQLETIIVADALGTAQVTLWAELYESCSGFIYLDAWQHNQDEDSESEVHDTYYAFFNLPCGGGGEGPEWDSQNGNLEFVFTDGTANADMHQEAWPYMILEEITYPVGIHAYAEPNTNVIISYEIEGQGDNTIAEGESALFTDETGHAFDDFLLAINGWDCFVIVEIELYTEDEVSGNIDWLDAYEMMIEGPCSGGSGTGLISVTAIDMAGNSLGDPSDISMDSGDYEFAIEIYGMTEGTEYYVSAGVYEGIHGVKDVVEQLFEQEPQMQLSIVADASGSEGISLPGSFGPSCSGFIFVDVWYSTETDGGDENNHDTYYAFFELPGCEDDGEGDDGLIYNIEELAIGENYHAIFWGEWEGNLAFSVGYSMLLDVTIRDKIDKDFGNADGITTWDEVDMFYMAFFAMLEEQNPANFMYPCDTDSDQAPLIAFNDGYSDCPDGSDEPSYDSDGNDISVFHCWDDDDTTITISQVNDGVVDCPNGLDEIATMSTGPDGLLSDGQDPTYMSPPEVWFDGLTSDSFQDPVMVSEWSMEFEDLSPGDTTYELSFVGDESSGDDGSDDDADDDDGSNYSSEVCAISGLPDLYDITSAVVNGTGVALDPITTCFEFPWNEPMPPFTITWTLNPTADTDGDGVHDEMDAFPLDPTEWIDSDGDGRGDNSDAFPDDPNEWVDTDNDGIGDNADLDADGDGVNDDSEDSDGDGVNDDTDDFPFDATEWTDTDGDGIGNNSDAFPDDPSEWNDTDGDGIGDNSDPDADGDGIENGFDDFPLNSEESTDTDGDGVGDTADAFPTDPNEWADADGDLTGDNADDDDDNDGTKDVDDAFPFDSTEDTDTDSDGVGDNADAFPDDPYERKDSDGDGVGDNADVFPSNPAEYADSDGDGVGNNQDAFDDDPNEIADTDEDGVGNNADQCPTEKEDSNDGDGCPSTTTETTEEDDDDGGLFGLPGFSATLGMISLLGAASLASGRRKD